MLTIAFTTLTMLLLYNLALVVAKFNKQYGIFTLYVCECFGLLDFILMLLMIFWR